MKAKQLKKDLTAEIEYPRLQRNLPSRLLSEVKVAKVMNPPDLARHFGLRDIRRNSHRIFQRIDEPKRTKKHL